MKRFIFCLILSSSIFFLVCAQSKDMPYSYYPPGYDTLKQTDWPEMKKTFETFLSFKSIEEVSNYAYPSAARFTLARITSIDWNVSMKKEVSSYLSYFLDQFLQGHSYLKIDNISVPGYYPMHHPVYLPKNVLWALFLIDNELACSKIKDIWIASSGLPAGSYEVNLSEFTFWLFDNTNDKNANEFFLNNYTFLKNSFAYDSDRINRVKLKCEISGINDQKKAWEYLWNNSGLDDSKFLTDNVQFLWYDNINLMKKVFGGLDLETIKNISETSSSLSKKYIFLYSVCFNINYQLSSNPNFKPSESMINYIDKAVGEIQVKSVQFKKAGDENDYLMRTFDSMKSNLLK